ncbi:hypothetical protein [Burkholderia gladioli]|nr:hypothetical protein [Burkholderia gladioli]
MITETSGSATTSKRNCASTASISFASTSGARPSTCSTGRLWRFQDS